MKIALHQLPSKINDDDSEEVAFNHTPVQDSYVMPKMFQ